MSESSAIVWHALRGKPIAFPESLPVSSQREVIAKALLASPVIIVCGETGSGKTTQLPKICLGLGRGKINQGGLIGHTSLVVLPPQVPLNELRKSWALPSARMWVIKSALLITPVTKRRSN